MRIGLSIQKGLGARVVQIFSVQQGAVVHITQVKIKNFRALQDIDLSLAPFTVILGENSVGKSAVLDAIKIALGRRWGTRGTGFTEYDFFQNDAIGGPSASPGISIEITCEEEKAGLWPEELVQELVEVVQTLDDGRNAVFLKVTCTYNKDLNEIEPGWSFLRADGQPLTGKATRKGNMDAFYRALPIFSLAALRDASQEFSSRSSLWGAMLKRVEIPDDQKAHIQAAIDLLNADIVNKDPLLTNLKGHLGKVGTILAPSIAKEVDIRPLPLKTWDLMSRSELAVRGGEKLPWFPLERHGQGVQSLAVFYLFQAFAKIALGATGFSEYSKVAEPVLTVEEPEAHLHPQATRALWSVVNSLVGQKIVTTHSPYFAQSAPFASLRIIRRTSEGCRVFQLRDSFFAHVPKNEALEKVIAKYKKLLRYDEARKRLVCMERLDEPQCKELIVCYTDPATRNAHHAALREMQHQSFSWISPDELSKLEDWARRIRGEIFFARAWLLCEGQSEFFVLPALAEKVQFPLDANGVGVIDYQNNGSPGAFVGLAESFGFPWVMTCDGDQGGQEQSEAAAARCPPSKLPSTTKYRLSVRDFEAFLLVSELAPLATKTAQAMDPALVGKSIDELSDWMRLRKTEFALKLADRIRLEAKETDVPKFYKDLFADLAKLVGSST